MIEPKIHRDGRGHFAELYQERRYEEAGIPPLFVQDNLSRSTHGVLRGLHYQNPSPQGKLVSALFGEILDVAVDIRPESETYGQWVAESLSGENGFQLWVPPGFAHGFVVTGAVAVVCYKVTSYYDPAGDGSILWNDPDIGIDWPIKEPVLSDKDARAPLLKDVPRERLAFG